MLKLKLKYFGHLLWRADSLEKTLMLGKIEAGGEGDNRGWDGWMASLTQWTLVWVDSGSWWWTGRPGVLQSMGSQRVGHHWATKLNGLVVFPTSFNLSLNFATPEFMIWATINSRSYFCWLFRASPSSATKNIIDLILILTIWWCPCVESSLVLLEESVC